MISHDRYLRVQAVLNELKSAMRDYKEAAEIENANLEAKCQQTQQPAPEKPDDWQVGDTVMVNPEIAEIIKVTRGDSGKVSLAGRVGRITVVWKDYKFPYATDTDGGGYCFAQRELINLTRAVL